LVFVAVDKNHLKCLVNPLPLETLSCFPLNCVPIKEDAHMPARLLNRALTRFTPTTTPPKRPSGIPDPGYEALSRLTQLRDFLSSVTVPPRSRWKVPPLFFFDTQREIQRKASCTAPQADPFSAVSARIAAEMPLLCGSVEVRRVARTIEGLQAAAQAIAQLCTEAKNLAELLAIPDDEAILVIHPETRNGFRVTVRGVADVGQFHVLMAAAISEEPGMATHVGQAVPDRFVVANRNDGPPIPAGIPMVMEARFQMYTPAAIRPDGTLPTGLRGSDHWLWPTSPLAAVPRMGGERMVLLGPPAYNSKWDVRLRFQGMPADFRVVESLGPFRAAEQLSRLTGKPIQPIQRQDQERELLKAA
jgi:hypothetical protein